MAVRLVLPLLLVASGVALAGYYLIDTGDVNGAQSGTNSTLGQAPDRVTRTTLPLAALLVGAPDDSTPGVLLTMGTDHAVWFQDLNEAAPQFATERPDANLRGAVRAPSQPILAVRESERITLRSITSDKLGEPERVVEITKETEWLDERFSYDIAASGVEAVGYTVHDDVTKARSPFVALRAQAGTEWTSISLAPDGVLYDADVEGNDFHGLVVSTSGAHYVRLDMTTEMVYTPELVFGPVGLAMRIDAGEDTVAVAIAEPNGGGPLDAAQASNGVLIATRTDSGWDIQPTFRPMRGGFLDMRLEPSLRLLVHDTTEPNAEVRNRVYAPAASGQPWKEVIALRDSVFHPILVEHSNVAVVPPSPVDAAGPWFALASVP